MKKLLLRLIYLLSIGILSQDIGMDKNVNMEGTSHYHLVEIGSENEKYYRSIDIYESRFFIFRKYASFNFGRGYIKKNLVIGYDSISIIGEFYKKGGKLYLTLKEEDNKGKVFENTYLAIKKDSCKPSEHYYSDFELEIDLPISEQANENIIFFKGGVLFISKLTIGYKKESKNNDRILIYEQETPIPFDSIKIKAQEAFASYQENHMVDNVAIEADKSAKMQLIDSIRGELRNIGEFQQIYFACNNPKSKEVKYIIMSNISDAWKRDIDEAVKGKTFPFLLFKIRENNKITYYQTKINHSEIAKELENESNFTALNTNQLQELLKTTINDKLLIYIDYLPSLSFGEYIYFHTQIRLALHSLRNQYALKKYQKNFDDLEDDKKDEIKNIYPLQYIEPRQIRPKK